ncbi:MAG: hypothetical protein HYR73_04845 [Candidatus Eisenbacteria bacterium]|nr:hypothetical protein [Candidatus Eisenbacteria bacterium]
MQLTDHHTERGFSMMEAIVATVIAVIAVLGLAYSFGEGRALIGQYETSRAALAAAQGCLDSLSVLPPSDGAFGVTPPPHSKPFMLGGQTIGLVQWDVLAYPDSIDTNPFDLKQVTVTVSLTAGSMPSSIRLSRLFPGR